MQLSIKANALQPVIDTHKNQNTAPGVVIKNTSSPRLAFDTISELRRAAKAVTQANRWIAPHNRLAPSLGEQLMQSAPIAGVASPRPLERATFMAQLDRVPRTAENAPTLSELLAQNDHDGFLLLHAGRVVVESVGDVSRALGGLHDFNSASKVLTGLLVGVLIGEGRMALDAPLERYLPGLVGRGYEGVTIADALDMRSGVAFSPTEEFYAVGRHPRQGPHPAIGVRGLAFSRPAEKVRPTTEYAPCSVDTDVLGLVCESVTGENFGDLISNRIWKPVGAGNARFLLDQNRTPLFSGGLLSHLHDVARLGEMVRNNGCVG